MARRNRSNPDVVKRVEPFVRGADLGGVTAVLHAGRDEILQRWLDATARQPFHEGRRERAVADHIPRLFDALVDILGRTAPRSVDAESPLVDQAVLEAAQEHARVRVEQGLQAADVVVELRLLRQEIGRTLRFNLSDDVPAGDTIGAALLVNDTLDGAISLFLSAVTQYTDEAREDFLATTVHEVRQPITSIKGSIQLAGRYLAQPVPDLERVGAALRRAETATDRMIAMVATLIDVSRLSFGRFDLELTSADLVRLLNDVLGRLEPDDLRRVVLDLPPEMDATGQWDTNGLERVIGNLLSNALKYSPSETPVEVAVRCEPDAVQLCVRDHGIGLTADDDVRLFRRYGRARAASDSGATGLGLGLYLCRGIVEAHGGRIWAESPGPGLGTTMCVLLPRQAPTDLVRDRDGQS